MVKKLLITLAVFFILAFIVILIFRGLSSLNLAIDIPFFGDDTETPAATSSGGTSSGGSSFFSSARDAFFSPVSYFSGSGSSSSTAAYFTPTYGQINVSDSFTPEDYQRYLDAWESFENGPDETGTTDSGTTTEAYFDTSLYFGPSSVDEAQHFGDPSAWYRKVVFSDGGYSFGWYGEVNPPQYITIESPRTTDVPVTISGWSLQSLNTGVRLYIPNGVRILRTGEAAQLQPITLAPGEKAIIAAFKSPVGTSFKENVCSGYLDQFQTYIPELQDNCPLPSEELQPTLSNTATYGETCYEFLSYMRQCEFHNDDIPEYLTANCGNFVRERLTYNGCVKEHSGRVGFLNDTWRVYLNTPSAPWQSSDVIRLLDAEGRVVDVLRI